MNKKSYNNYIIGKYPISLEKNNLKNKNKLKL